MFAISSLTSQARKWREEDNAKGLRDIKVHPELHETFSLIKRRTRTGEPG
ncbi:unnamed protein product, partial [Allacma fusca]